MSNDYRDIKDIAKDVRAELKVKFPQCKFSVAIERFTGGSELRVALMEAPMDALTSGEYAQVNHYVVRDYDYEDYQGPACDTAGEPIESMTMYGFRVMKAVEKIANRENWDESDPMVDYFHCNYYFNLAIGKWNKPFKVVAR